MYDVHVGSPAVWLLPSDSPLRIACIGRQKLKAFLECHAQMTASAAAVFARANRRARLPRLARSGPPMWAAASSRIRRLNWPEKFPEKIFPMCACSRVRTVLLLDPSAFTWL